MPLTLNFQVNNKFVVASIIVEMAADVEKRKLNRKLSSQYQEFFTSFFDYLWKNENDAAWSHPDDWPNYTTVYLWHEILHFYFNHNNLSHALVELIADNELRVFLNEGTYPPSDNKNILEFEKKMIEKYGTEFLSNQ